MRIIQQKCLFLDGQALDNNGELRQGLRRLVMDAELVVLAVKGQDPVILKSRQILPSSPAAIKKVSEIYNSQHSGE